MEEWFICNQWKWTNDWPVIGIDKDGDGKGEPVLVYKKPNVGKTYPIQTPAESDEFNSTKIGLQWQWQANPQSAWTFPTSSGFLRMFSVYQPDSISSLWNAPNILAQKITAEEFTATMKLSFHPKYENEQIGLVISGTDYEYIAIKKKNDGLYAYAFACENADKGNKEEERFSFPVKGNDFYLQVKVEKTGICHFIYSDNGERFTTIVKSFSAKPGRWVGAKVGLFCTRTVKTNDSGFADIDWFRIEKN
jgi:beta-xylosidase